MPCIPSGNRQRLVNKFKDVRFLALKKKKLFKIFNSVTDYFNCIWVKYVKHTSPK